MFNHIPLQASLPERHLKYYFSFAHKNGCDVILHYDIH
jgi:hypothetical protein